MTNFITSFKSSAWLIAILAAALATGCGGGHWDSRTAADPVTQPPVVVEPPVVPPVVEPPVVEPPIEPPIVEPPVEPPIVEPPIVEPPVEPPVVAPTVTNSNPDDGAVNIAVDSAASVTFDTAMDADSFNETTFTLTGPNNEEVTGAVTYTASNMTATFTPANDLEFGTLYTALITTGAQNAAGTDLANEHSWSFTTIEEEIEFLTVTDTNPLNGGEQICTNKTISITFDSPLDPDTIESPASSFTLANSLTNNNVAGEVTLDAMGTTATFTPTAELAAGEEYTATVNTDATGVNENVLENDEVWSFTIGEAVCQGNIALGAAEPYGVLSNTGATLGGGPNSVTGLRVDGDVGISPTGECVGCDTTTVSGSIDIGNDPAAAAMNALNVAYNETMGRATNRCTLIDSGILTTNPSAACGGGANGVFKPGLYWSATSMAIPAGGTITLDAQNDPDAVFIFQSESTINSIGGNTHIILANSAQAKNVFWVAGSSATIGGVNSDFAGTVLANIGVTVNTGTAMLGRALAKGAAVTVQDGALITVPAE